MGGGTADALSALAAVVGALACPVCGDGLVLVDGAPRSLRCPAGHAFDVARQGHVVLLHGATRLRADTADMVAARERVLGSGAYHPVTAAVVDAVRAAAPPGGLVVDLGAGTGHHTAALLEALPDRHGVALELSVPALRRVVRAHPRLAAVGVDVTRSLPLLDATAGAVLAVFAPLPDVAELARVCAPGALLAVVTPEPSHLGALRSRLDLLDVPGGKPDRLDARLAPGFEPVARTGVAAPVVWSAEQAADVVAMGPNAWHPSAEREATVRSWSEQGETVDDVVAVTVSVLRRRHAEIAVRGGR